MGLFRTLLIIVISYYVFKFLFRWFSIGNRKRSKDNKSENANSSTRKKPGSDGGGKLGKYVDYEDIND